MKKQMEKPGNANYVLIQYDFVPAETNELGVRAGETVRLHYECQGWYFVETSHELKGYVPKSYCNIISRAIPKSNSGSTTQNRYQKIKAQREEKHRRQVHDVSNGNIDSDENVNANRITYDERSNSTSPWNPEAISCGSYNSRTGISGISRNNSIVKNGIRYYCREKDWRKPQSERRGQGSDQTDTDSDKVSNSDSMNSETNNSLALPTITYTESSDNEFENANFRGIGEVKRPQVKQAKRVGLLKVANSQNNEQTLDSNSSRVEGRRNKKYFEENTHNYMYLPLQKKITRKFSSCEDIFKAYTSQNESRGIVVNNPESDNEDNESTRSAISSASVDDSYLDTSAERLRRHSNEPLQRSISLKRIRPKSSYDTCESIDNFLTSDTNACHTDSDSNRHSMDDDCDSGLYSESQSSETSDMRWSPPANYNYRDHSPPINNIDNGWSNSLRKKSQTLLKSHNSYMVELRQSKKSGNSSDKTFKTFKNIDPNLEDLQQGMSNVVV